MRGNYLGEIVHGLCDVVLGKAILFQFFPQSCSSSFVRSKYLRRE